VELFPVGVPTGHEALTPTASRTRIGGTGPKEINLAKTRSMRLMAWNCRSGSVTSRIADLVALAPDIVFLQEILPAESLPLIADFFSRRVAPGKGIAMGSLNPNWRSLNLERARKRFWLPLPYQ
jgi:hypothetical protein